MVFSHQEWIDGNGVNWVALLSRKCNILFNSVLRASKLERHICVKMYLDAREVRVDACEVLMMEWCENQIILSARNALYCAASRLDNWNNFLLPTFLKYHLLCCADERKSYRFELKRGCVNNDRNFYLKMNYLFNTEQCTLVKNTNFNIL